MKNKIPHDSDFEKFVRQALQKTDGTPDENTWANIAARQSSRNFRLQIRHYGLRLAPVMVAIILAVGGWKYFTAGVASPAGSEPVVPQQIMPVQQPQVNIAEPLPGVTDFKNLQAKDVEGKSSAVYRWKDIPANTERFVAEEGLRYKNPSTGTSVFIPANSLIHADGRPVSGEVEFELREYRSIPDFLASGIPMHYTDERGLFFFNSGGMFDLRVNQNGEPLQLAAGQGCDVQFTSTHKLTDASLYYFDETKNAWTYQLDPAFTTSALPPVVTEATVERDNTGLQQDCLPNEIIVREGFWATPEDDEAAFRMQDAVQTGYDYAFGNITMPGWFRKHPTWSNEQLLGGLERSVIRMRRHKDAQDMFFPEDVNNMFTELQAFKDCYFIVNTGLGSKRTFTQEDFDSYWDRVSVVQEKGALCYVSFFGKQGLLQFWATLTGSMENPDFDADKVMAEYARLRNQRQQNFEKQANSWRNFLFMAHIFQEPEEWCMDPFDWFDYFDANLPLMRKRYAALKEQGISDDKQVALNAWETWEKRLREIQFDNTTNKRSYDRKMGRGKGLNYALRVNNFGCYNCDQIYNIFRGQEVVFIMATYQSADGRQIVPKYVGAIEKSSWKYFAPRANQMLCLPGRRIDIIVTDDNGRFYRMPGSRYALLDLDNQKTHTFTVEDVTEKVQTPRDWAELLEI